MNVKKCLKVLELNLYKQLLEIHSVVCRSTIPCLSTLESGDFVEWISSDIEFTKVAI